MRRVIRNIPLLRADSDRNRNAASRPSWTGRPATAQGAATAEATTRRLTTVHSFHYEAAAHETLPHVVKFSGGRSSALLLFSLLESKLLRPERGDVVVFNNTSAEHPETYRFTRECKRRVELDYGVPFFWIEFQTYEDARNGDWTRLPSYRLVHPEPWSSAHPNGYRCRGEVFEELLSHDGYVPSIFQRTCTKKLKLEPTRAFLKDWFADRPVTERLGHFGQSSRIDEDSLYEQHRRHGGNVPRDVLVEKKRCVLDRPTVRPAQRFADYSPAVRPFDTPYLAARTFGGAVTLGPAGVEYVAFVGLRHDEQNRVHRVRKRNAGGPASSGYEGEHIYMPLSDMGIDKVAVDEFWRRRRRPWRLQIEPDLSNCTYCFLKGVGVLSRVHGSLQATLTTDTSLRNSPSDIDWWIGQEERYGRDLHREKRSITGDAPDGFIGFFGAKVTYRKLAEAGWDKSRCSGAGALRACDCTD